MPGGTRGRQDPFSSRTLGRDLRRKGVLEGFARQVSASLISETVRNRSLRLLTRQPGIVLQPAGQHRQRGQTALPLPSSGQPASGRPQERRRCPQRDHRSTIRRQACNPRGKPSGGKPAPTLSCGLNGFATGTCGANVEPPTVRGATVGKIIPEPDAISTDTSRRSTRWIKRTRARLNPAADIYQ